MGFFAALGSVFKFWDEIMILVKMLEKTPEQQHAQLMDKVKATFDEGANNGRPKWD